MIACPWYSMRWLGYCEVFYMQHVKVIDVTTCVCWSYLMRYKLTTFSLLISCQLLWGWTKLVFWILFVVMRSNLGINKEGISQSAFTTVTVNDWNYWRRISGLLISISDQCNLVGQGLCFLIFNSQEELPISDFHLLCRHTEPLVVCGLCM
jgi:hypothetical protein